MTDTIYWSIIGFDSYMCTCTCMCVTCVCTCMCVTCVCTCMCTCMCVTRLVFEALLDIFIFVTQYSNSKMTFFAKWFCQMLTCVHAVTCYSATVYKKSKKFWYPGRAIIICLRYQSLLASFTKWLNLIGSKPHILLIGTVNVQCT